MPSKELQEYIVKQSPFEVVLGKTHVFPPSPSSDGAAVVVVLVESPDLHRIHEELASVVRFKPSDFIEYIPHITLAYIKPEMAEQYDGKDWLEGVSFEVDSITISTWDRIQITVPFRKQEGTKTAGRREESTTSLTMGSDVGGFPPVVVVRWPQGMRWRTVLKAVKQIANEVAGRRIPWRSIFVWESLWGTYAEQQEGWEQYRARGNQVMYDITPDNTFASVGRQTIENAGEAKMAAERIKGTPGSDDWECICGFISRWESISGQHSGFYPCNRQGKQVDPTEEDWDGIRVRCAACGRIIDTHTMEVMAWAPYDLFGESVMLPKTKRGTHKVTPLSDTEFPELGIGQETNAYADIPEKVHGDETLPPLEELAPQMFEKSASLPDFDDAAAWANVNIDEMVDWGEVEPLAKAEAEAAGEDWDALDEDRQNVYAEPIIMEQLQGRYENISRLHNGKFPLVIYRAVTLEQGVSPETLNTKEFGVHWSWDVSGAFPYCGNINKETYVFRGQVNRDQINWADTAGLNVTNDLEKEIRLYPGEEVPITGWKLCRDSKWRKPSAHFRTVTAARKTAAVGTLTLYHVTTTPVATKIRAEGFKPVPQIEWQHYYAPQGRDGVYFYADLHFSQSYAEYFAGKLYTEDKATKRKPVALAIIKVEVPKDIVHTTEEPEDGYFVPTEDLGKVKIKFIHAYKYMPMEGYQEREKLGAVGGSDKLFTCRTEVMDARRGELFGKAEAKTDDGAIIGYVQFSEYDDEIWIKYVEVAPAWRRKGVATAMYQKIKEDFPGEKIVSSGTTDEGGAFRRSLTERGILTASASTIPSLDDFLKRYHGLGTLYKDYEAYPSYKDEDTLYAALKNKYARFVREWGTRKFPLTLYRGYEMMKGGIDDVDFTESGHNWTWDLPTAEEFAGNLDGLVLEARVDADAVDWYGSMWNNFYPYLGETEAEVTLKKGASIEIVGYKSGAGHGYVPGAQPEKWVPYKRTVTAAYAEQYNGTPQHTRHDNVQMYKAPKDDPFGEETEMFESKEAGMDENPLDIASLPLGQRVHAGDILDYILAVNEDFEDRDRIYRHDYFELRLVDVAKIDAPWSTDPDTVDHYSAMPSEFPPIVVDAQFTVIDGTHRVVAAAQRGDEQIKAFVPVRKPRKKAGMQPPPFDEWVKKYPQFNISSEDESAHDPSGDSTTRVELEERYSENTQWSATSSENSL